MKQFKATFEVHTLYIFKSSVIKDNASGEKMNDVAEEGGKTLLV